MKNQSLIKHLSVEPTGIRRAQAEFESGMVRTYKGDVIYSGICDARDSRMLSIRRTRNTYELHSVLSPRGNLVTALNLQ
jgi:hypothetical protein